MKTAHVIRHVSFEDLDAFAPLLAARGFTVHEHDAPVGLPPDEALLDADLLVILGGPIGVYETAHYPFVAREIELARRRMAADRPLLGICLGAQIMAAALGASVHPGTNGKEIGWSTLAYTDAGRASPLGELAAADAPVLHWHGDTFDLPDGATLLASTDRYAHQAFSKGRAMALQFHLEVDIVGLERWYVGHTMELGSVKIAPPELRAEAAVNAPKLRAARERFLGRWLDEVGL
jgi:GMP synthase (glutamine-hydrolysing)